MPAFADRRVGVGHTAHRLAGHRQASLKAQRQLRRLVGRVGDRTRRRPRRLGQVLPGPVGLLSADGGAEDPEVERVLGGEVGDRVAALAQEVALLLTRVLLVADQPGDLQLGRQRLGDGIEADVVVARARRAVRDDVGAAVHRDARHLLGLEHPLDPDAGRIHAVAQVVGLEDVGDELLEEPGAPVDDDVLVGPELLGALRDLAQLVGGKPAGVDGDGRHPLAAVNEYRQRI